MAASPHLVVINHKDIAGSALDSKIASSFGPDGLGILTVLDVPYLRERRERLLPLAARFAGLPPEVAAKYEHEGSQYNFGWSCGRESLQGRPDTAKGSYYANPQYDRPVDDEATIATYPSFVHPNIWPDADVPGFSEAFKELGQLVVDTGLLVAQQCDRYVERRCPSYEAGKMRRVIATSLCCKGRLLHYFARDAKYGKDGALPTRDSVVASTPEAEVAAEELQVDVTGAEEEFSDWCGWHNDHCSLTGLVPAMFLDTGGREVKNPDPEAGLYIRSRQGVLVKVHLPPGAAAEDTLLFQIGEAAQLHSGGLLAATPHAVRGPQVPGVSRETFAVFMEPMWDEPMDPPPGSNIAAAICPPLAGTGGGSGGGGGGQAAVPLPAGMTPLAERWKPGASFGDFTKATLNAYY